MNNPMEILPYKFSYLSKNLKNLLNSYIPHEKDKKSFGKFNLGKLFYYCYLQGKMDAGEDLSKLCFKRDMDITDIQAEITKYLSDALLETGAPYAREAGSLIRICERFTNQGA